MSEYFIHTDNSYTGADEPTLQRFTGTFRELLFLLNDISDPEGTFEDRDGVERKNKSLTNAELLDLFNNANGDGMNYTTVFQLKSDGDGEWFEVVVK